jgi:prolyl 4-hydroxylase
MQFESLAVDLKSWLRESIGRGCEREALVQALRAAGHQPKFARQAVALAYTRFGAPQAVGAPDPADPARRATAAEPLDAAPPMAAGPADPAGRSDAADLADDATGGPQSAAGASSSAILAASPNAIETSDRLVNILFALNAPRILLFGNLLSADECDELVRLSRGKLERSSVVNAATGTYDVHPDRTSEGTHFQRGENPLIRTIERRIGEMLGYPVDHGEPIQILHYGPGAQYRPHFDFFDPGQPGNEQVLAMGGQRIATLVMYLNDVEAGGSTIFPEVGLDVLPHRGSAVYFAYGAPDGQLDRRTLPARNGSRPSGCASANTPGRAPERSRPQRHSCGAPANSRAGRGQAVIPGHRQACFVIIFGAHLADWTTSRGRQCQLNSQMCVSTRSARLGES